MTPISKRSIYFALLAATSVLVGRALVMANLHYFRFFDITLLFITSLALFAAALVVIFWPSRPAVRNGLLGVCAAVGLLPVVFGLVQTHQQYSALLRECAGLRAAEAAGNARATVIAKAFQCPL